MKKGKVWLVGAGPGDIGLLTVKARDLIQTAEFIAYDALIGDEILCSLPEATRKVSVGKRSGRHSVPQEQINQILLEEALAGKQVVRLKGGDPFVFGRGGEELELLVENKIPFEVVPGITSAVAVPTYAGIPVTHREYTSSFHVITGHPRKDGKDRIDYEALVRFDATLVFLMSISRMGGVLDNLIKAGMDSQTPAAVLERGTQYNQRRVVSTVGQLEKEAEKADIRTPALIIVGKVCALSRQFEWYEKQPLAGKQILVTRSTGRAGRLAQSLRESGAQVLEVPMIEMRLLKPEEIDLRPLKCQQDQRELWLTFTSPMGVVSFFEAMVYQHTDMRMLLKQGDDIKFAAVGSTTAAELAKYGWRTDLIPDSFDAESLGLALTRTVRKNAKVILLRAKESQQGLTDELDKAEVDWTDIPLYETISRSEAPFLEQLKEKIEAGELHMVTFTSASTVKAFVSTVKGVDYTRVNALCIGSSTAEAAEKYGMKVTVSEKATIKSMIDKAKEMARVEKGYFGS